MNTRRTPIITALACLVLGLLAFSALPTHAQLVPGPAPVTLWAWPGLDGPTNNTAVWFTSKGTLYTNEALTGVIDCRGYENLWLHIGMSSNTNKPGTNTVYWMRSLDGTYYDTNSLIPTALERAATPAAGARFTLVTNITVKGVNYIKPLFWTNDAIGAGNPVLVTNLEIKFLRSNRLP